MEQHTRCYLRNNSQYQDVLEIHKTQSKKERITELYKNTRERLVENEQRRKDIIMSLAHSIEQEGLLPTDLICEEIVRAARGYKFGIGPQYIRKCLDKKYKRKYEKKKQEENAPTVDIISNNVLAVNETVKGQEFDSAANDSYSSKVREIVRDVYRNFQLDVEKYIRDQELGRLIREKEKNLTRISELEHRTEELERQLTREWHLKIPTTIGAQLQSMLTSKEEYAYIVVVNGVYRRLDSHD